MAMGGETGNFKGCLTIAEPDQLCCELDRESLSVGRGAALNELTNE